MDHRFTLLLLCFLLSGFSALLYQTAWMREFAFIFGTSELALAAVLAGYMGGLAVGSALAARLASRIQRPVLVYGVLELLIALCAVGMPFGLSALTSVYVSAFGGGAVSGEPGALATLFRLAGAFALLLLPTALMGATLPLLARHAVRRDDEVGPRVGALYAINTAGAIGGTVVAAFWLLPSIGLRQTVYVGAGVNALVFLAAAALARGAPLAGSAPVARQRVETSGAWILPLMTLSGAVSFSYEVLWVRLLSQLLGGSVYAFATMLSSFLLGIAIGSALGGRIARRPEDSAGHFALVQLWIAALALLAYFVADPLPGWATALGAGWKASPLANAPIAAAVLLPVALCIGATFPLAVRVLVANAADTATGTARVYAWNTVGAIIGSIGTGFYLLPLTGFVGTAKVGAATSLLLAALAGLLAKPRLRWPAAAAALGGLLVALLPMDNPWRLLRSFPIGGDEPGEHVRFFEVGRSATVLLTERPGNFRIFTNGLPESQIDKKDAVPGQDMLSRWLGLLPSLLRSDVRNMLVVGLGGGNALEGVSPSVETVDVVELEPEVVAANRLVGPDRQVDPLAQPRVRVIVNDARGALMLSDTRYDAIVSQPSHPWTAGASHLYTLEFFELVRERLSDDGIFVQWIGLAFVDEFLMRSLIATLDRAFPQVHVYLPMPGGVLFAASKTPFGVGEATRQALREEPVHLARYGVLIPEDVAATQILDDAGCAAIAEGATINSDDHNHLSTRSARIDENFLRNRALMEIVGPHDPLRQIGDLDPVRLVSSLLRIGRIARAETVAEQQSGADREIALGWIAGWHDRKAEAARRFATALETQPDSLYAHAGLLVFDLPAIGTAPDEVALLRRDWKRDPELIARELTELDPRLAAIGLHHPLFQTASRLRARWRLQSRDPQLAVEALEILDLVMPTHRSLDVQLSRVDAAFVAGRENAAWVGLYQVARELGPDVAPRQLHHALWLADALPDHPLAARVRQTLQGKLQR